MFLNPKEMELLCIFHAGTVSETLTLLRTALNEQHEKAALIKTVLEKLDGAKEGETVSLAFEPEK